MRRTQTIAMEDARSSAIVVRAMSARTLARPIPILAFPIALVTIYAVVVTIARTQPLDAHGGLIAYAIMADLVLFVPGLWYLLVVRGRGVKARTVIPITALSALGAALVLPPPWRGELRVLILPVELAATGLLIWAASKIAQRRPGEMSTDAGTLPERIAEAARSAFGLGRLADLVAYEIGLFAYAVAGWRMRPVLDARSFTVHRESGWSGAAMGLGLVVVVETFPVHVLVAHWSSGLAWILSALSAYSLLWLIGDAQALRLRPCRVEDDAVLIRIGLRWKALVPRRTIAAVTTVTGDAPPRRGRDYLRATVLGSPTLILELNEPVTVHGPYGTSRQVRRLGLAPDDRAAFLAALGR